MKEENKGMVALTNFLAKEYPRNAVLAPLSTPPTKNPFMNYLRAYSPDKQTECPKGWKHDLDAWKDFCTQAAKALNYYYETQFKNMEP